MGLSIHYRGNIRHYSLVNELTEEVEDICNSLQWKYYIWEKERPVDQSASVNTNSLKYSPDDLRGRSVSPDECEPLFITFLPNGALCSPLKLMYNDPATNDLMIEVIHTKTQFAGPDTHIALLKLLRYLKNKYFTELEVNDEGLYWETRDEKVLLSQFAKYNYLLKKVTEALSDFKARPAKPPSHWQTALKHCCLKNLARRSNGK